MVTHGHSYLKNVRPLPPVFHRLCAGDAMTIGARSFKVMTGAGHAPEQVMLYCAAENLFFAADQVLNRISPNVSVWAIDPDDDVLGRYINALEALIRQVPDDALVLPGHDMPFSGLHRRIGELIASAMRCGIIVDACRAGPKSAADLIPYIFHRTFGPHELGFAFSETLSHINYLLRRNRLATVRRGSLIEIVATGR